MSAFICLENTKNLLHLLGTLSKQYRFRARNSHCRIIDQKLGSFPAFFSIMKQGNKHMFLSH